VLLSFLSSAGFSCAFRAFAVSRLMLKGQFKLKYLKSVDFRTMVTWPRGPPDALDPLLGRPSLMRRDAHGRDLSLQTGDFKRAQGQRQGGLRRLASPTIEGTTRPEARAWLGSSHNSGAASNSPLARAAERQGRQEQMTAPTETGKGCRAQGRGCPILAFFQVQVDEHTWARDCGT